MTVFRQTANKTIKLFIYKIACNYAKETKRGSKIIREREYPSLRLFQAAVKVGHCFFVTFGHVYESAYVTPLHKIHSEKKNNGQKLNGQKLTHSTVRCIESIASIIRPGKSADIQNTQLTRSGFLKPMFIGNKRGRFWPGLKGNCIVSLDNIPVFICPNVDNLH